MAVQTLTLLSSVTINEPSSNETVSSPFAADGTYAIDSPTGQGYVMCQVQPAGDPPSPTGWQPLGPSVSCEEPQIGEWSPDAPGKPGNKWQGTATSSTGAKTFYAAAFKPDSQTPVAVASVNITVS